MDAALRRLLLLRLRGGIRYRLRQFASPRGAVFLAIAAAIAWLALGTEILTPGNELGRVAREESSRMREGISNLMPLGLFGACIYTLFAARGPALHFPQNEIDFLFAGPFSRRSLIVYKCCAYCAGAVLSAAIIAVLIPQRASSAPFAFTGSLLTLLFIQLSSAAVSMFAQVYEDSWFIRVRKPTILLLLAVASAATVYATATTGRTVVDVLLEFRNSPFGSTILFPFVVFAELFLAERLFPDLAGWAIGAIAIDGALLLVIVELGGRASDRSLSESERLSNRWARMRQGASFWVSDKTTGHSLRRAPVLGGLGPVIWRQLINAIRNSGRAIAVFFVIAVLTGPVLASAPTERATHGLIGLVYFFIAFLMPRTLVCDFRGELGNIELYKALPVAPWRICAGQLVVPVLLSSAIELVMICSTLLFFEGTTATVLIALTVFTVPFSLLLYGLENLVMLVFPTRLLPIGRVDFDFIGRTLMDFMLKTIIIVTAVVGAGAAGYATLHATGQSWFWFGLVSWLTIAILGLLTVPSLGYAFRRFNVSQALE
jgi:hypothetical protein